MGRLFGTDGVRGVANRDVTAEVALDVSVAAAHVLGLSGAFDGHRPRAVVGRDTRASGEFLSAAVIAGLASAGVDVVDVGVLPTPGVAYLTGALGVDIGVMISASHNPMADNGIKFFARGGHKLPDDVEDAIERRMGEPWQRPIGADVGRVTADPGIAEELYIANLIETLPEAMAGTGLTRLRIAVDCANGAASAVGPTALRAAGADVVVINASPDGRNINDQCGSTHMEPLRAAVVAAEADLGVAFDGDADRCLAVDATGEVVDGDQVMGILAVALKDRGELAHDTLVTTVVSNLGLTLSMEAEGIRIVQTAVGDRYVQEAMRSGGFVLGGEQTGHLIISAYATSGDGILTALQLASRMAETGRSLADLAAGVAKLPQVLINVHEVDRTRAATDEGVRDAVLAAEATLGASGRVLLRPSGTEPLVRLMVEATDLEVAQRIADELALVVKERLAL